jgi:glycosyltransferase involved in cell wall biosynthesis
MTRDNIRRLRPDCVIAANKRMAQDLMNITRARCIYHHARLDAKPLELGRTLYYDGCEKHASYWLDVIRAVAVNYGWNVKCGKPENGAGGLLALRDYNTGLWLANRWKSNVKAANAIAYGLPLLGQPETGYLETLPDGWAVYFQNDSEARAAVARFCQNPVNVRGMNAEKYTAERAANDYEKLFEDLL